ncbi:MAG TPA: alkaline phosphatase D family protein [Enhygromyxa sp.]|nr:alkaline phosphatase D family protein [Enhygromyxa sp.]
MVRRVRPPQPRAGLGRRDFLRATLVSAAGLLAGCRPDDPAGETGDESGTDTDTETGGEPPREVVDGFEYFPQSVASGDPRPGSVILWTRVEDPDADQDIELELELANDPDFAEPIGELVVITASAAHDHCVKVRVTDLTPGAPIYYRFVYPKDGTWLSSRVGRAASAPEPSADVAVRFAVLSCQDFSRWYNVHHALAEQEFDFVVHLGDYIYETTGDPEFQAPIPGRILEFDDKDGAILFNEGQADEYYAAASLDNYRQLYRTYRGDRALQKVHERAPMIVTWDDHEFSNDCHGATGTYFGGRVDETDVARRKAANQAWFEYMPVDYQDDPNFQYDPAAEFPGDIVIYRDFVWGQHLHLAITDERTWRSDHPIREDAFPGTVLVDEATVMAELGELPDWARPYVDIDGLDGGSIRDALIAAATDLGLDPVWITGNLDALFINDLITTIDPDGTSLTPIPDDQLAMLPRGLSYASMGKSSFYGSFGARLLVNKPPYDLWTRLRYEQTRGASEEVLGETQEAWLIDTLAGSDRTWKVWGNEFSLGQIAVDVRDLAPAPFNQLYYLSLDLWDGHRNRRDTVLGQLAAVENMIAVTGDIHAFYAGTPFVTGDPEQRVVELVTSSVTSSSFKEILAVTVATNPALASFEEAALLVEALDTLLGSASLKTNQHLGYARSDLYGFVMIELDGSKLDATYNQVPVDYLLSDYGADIGALLGAFTTERFRVNAGERELYRDFSGEWRRWDRESMTWVA